MKLKRKKPCKECPFRKESSPGWLGPWDARSIVQQAHSEAGLACHVDGGVKKHLGDEELYDKVHVCVGSLQHANISHKSYRSPILNAFAKAVGTAVNIMGLKEFFEHHERIDRLIEEAKAEKK